MKDFGRMRAQYKANEEKKCELKKLVNIYTNRKKLDTKLLSKYRKNNYINNVPSPEKEEAEPNVNEHLSLNRFGSMSIKNLSAFKIIKENKSDKKYIPENVSEYNEYYYIQQQQEEEKKRKAEEKKRKEEEKEEFYYYCRDINNEGDWITKDGIYQTNSALNMIQKNGKKLFKKKIK